MIIYIYMCIYMYMYIMFVKLWAKFDENKYKNHRTNAPHQCKSGALHLKQATLHCEAAALVWVVHIAEVANPLVLQEGPIR